MTGGVRGLGSVDRTVCARANQRAEEGTPISLCYTLDGGDRMIF